MEKVRKRRRNRPRRPTPADTLTAAKRRATIRRWRRWSEAHVEDIGKLLQQVSVCRHLGEIARTHPKPADEGPFLGWLWRLHWIYLGLGVRRLVDSDPRTRSIGRLLFELIENPGTITRLWYRTLYPKEIRFMADQVFDELAGAGYKVLGARTVCGDLRRLEDRTRAVRTQVNKSFAHMDRNQRGPPFKELCETVEFVEKMVLKYHLLLSGKGLVSAEPVLQDDWTQVFLEPWIPDPSPLRGNITWEEWEGLKQRAAAEHMKERLALLQRFAHSGSRQRTTTE